MKRRIFITSQEVILTCILAGYICVCVALKDLAPNIVNWLGILVFGYCVYTYKIKTNSNWLNPYTIFQLFMIMFNYGQPMMWAIGIHREAEIGTTAIGGYIPTASELIHAQIYTCIAILIFHFGAMCFTKREGLINNASLSFYDESLKKNECFALKRVCGLLLFVVSPIVIIFRAYELVVARQYGYIALYYGEHMTQNGYMQIIIYFFFPAIVGYLVGNNYSRKSRIIVYSIFGVYAILGILAGDRGSWLYSLVVLVWLHTFYKKTPFHKYIKYGVIGIVMLYAMNAIVAVRDTWSSISNSQISEMFLIENSPIVDAFYEMGGSANILALFMKKGRDIYPYGNTYLSAILGMVSSRVLGLLGVKQVLIANWFSQEYLHISYGAGFSMLAEAYVNGGYYGGIVYMFVLGCIHGRLFRLSHNVSGNSSPLRVFLAAAGLNVMLGLIRGAVYLTLKQLFYGVFIVYITIKIVIRLTGKKIVA